jgi:hypothetical protein
MEEQVKELNAIRQTDPDPMLTLGTWLGRRQAFGMIANRCTAADAECLKAMRDTGEYKKMGLTWEDFCEQRAGLSRRHADRLIKHLEEFGANYFRLSELMEISHETYRLIAGAVSEDGIEHGGEKIPMTRVNRKRVMAAVEAMRGKEKVKTVPSGEALLKRLETLLGDAGSLGPRERLVLIGMLDAGARRLSKVGE